MRRPPGTRAARRLGLALGLGLGLLLLLCGGAAFASASAATAGGRGIDRSSGGGGSSSWWPSGLFGGRSRTYVVTAADVRRHAAVVAAPAPAALDAETAGSSDADGASAMAVAVARSRAALHSLHPKSRLLRRTPATPMAMHDSAATAGGGSSSRLTYPPDPLPVPHPLVYQPSFRHPNDQEYVANDIDIDVVLRLDIVNASAQVPFEMHVKAVCLDTHAAVELRPFAVAHVVSSYRDYAESLSGAFVHDCLDRWIGFEVRVWGKYPNVTATTASAGAAAPEPPTYDRLVGWAYAEVHVVSNRVSIEYVACSCISVVCCLGVLYFYVRFESLRRFPSNLVFWRTLCDLLFAVQFIWLNAWEFEWRDDTQDMECNVGIAFITQFSMMGSLCWYFVLALNAYFSISNPFRMPQTKTTAYHAFVWTAAVVTGLLTLPSNAFRQDYRICWFRKRSGVNVYNWIGFFVWILVFMIVSVVILAWAWKKLQVKAMSDTLQTRKHSLEQTLIYVVVFTLYWTVAAGIWGAVFFTASGDPSEIIQDRRLSYIFALIAGLMGFCDSATWALVQRKALMKAWRERNLLPSGEAGIANAAGVAAANVNDSKDFDDISDALRYEFIQRAQAGIQAATVQEIRRALHKAKDTPLPQGLLQRSPKMGSAPSPMDPPRLLGEHGGESEEKASARDPRRPSHVGGYAALRAAEIGSRLLADSEPGDAFNTTKFDSWSSATGAPPAGRDRRSSSVYNNDANDQPTEAEAVIVVDILVTPSGATSTAASRRGSAMPAPVNSSAKTSLLSDAHQPGGSDAVDFRTPIAAGALGSASGLGGEHPTKPPQLRHAASASAASEKRAQSPTFRFRSYYPVIFHTLRNVVFGVSNEAYRKSMEGAPEDMIKHFSAGASGSFFYLSVDQRYMIKTLTKDEHRLLLRIARRYCRYMHAHRRSLICKFFGLYSIELYGHTEYIVVMNNFLRTPLDARTGAPLYRIDEIFDLKGSSINRHAKKKAKPPRRLQKDGDLLLGTGSGSGSSSGSSSGGNSALTSLRSRSTIVGAGGAAVAADHKEGDVATLLVSVNDDGGDDDDAERIAAERVRAENEAHKPVILKDNDLKKTVKIHGERAQFFIDQISLDSQFLRDQQIMDYSLLLGIHNCTERRHTDRHCNGLQQPVKARPSIFSPKPLTSPATATGGGTAGLLPRPPSSAALAAASTAVPTSPTPAVAVAVAGAGAAPTTPTPVPAAAVPPSLAAGPSLLTATLPVAADPASLLSGVPDELVEDDGFGTAVHGTTRLSVAAGRPTSPSLAAPPPRTPGRVSVSGAEPGTLAANAAGAALAHYSGDGTNSGGGRSSLETSLLPVLTSTPAGATRIPMHTHNNHQSSHNHHNHNHHAMTSSNGSDDGATVVGARAGDIALSPTRRSVASSSSAAMAAVDTKSDALHVTATASPTAAGTAAVAAAAAGAPVVVVASSSSASSSAAAAAGGPLSASLAPGSLAPAGGRVFHHASHSSHGGSSSVLFSAGGAAAAAGSSGTLESELEGSGAVSADVIVGPGIYHFGIIDVLQQWTWQKKMEQWAKRFLGCYCGHYVELSAVEPVFYSERFVGMVNRLFEK